jgi:hypothetical protein
MVLTVKVERRLAALKSSTNINRIQHPLFSVSVSEANASGMVSSFPTSFMRLATPHFSLPRECMVFHFSTWWMPQFLGGGSFHHGLTVNSFGWLSH